MPAKDTGELSEKLRVALALSTVVCVLVLALSPLKDFRAEWKHYKRWFVKYAQTRPETKELLADWSPGIDQAWLPEMNVTDRCGTCHQGIDKPSLVDASVPQPFRAHPSMHHGIRDWGCTICHRGEGLATEVADAHGTTADSDNAILPAHFLEASCGRCHLDDLREAPQLARGRELLRRLNCQACHKFSNPDSPELGPDLSSVGYKVSRQWIYKWLSERGARVPQDGAVTVNGTGTGGEPLMPKFRLNEADIRSLSALLSVQKAKPIETYEIDPAVVSRLSRSPKLLLQGEVHFRQMMCTTCHSLTETGGWKSKVIGGEMAPELTKEGSKVNREWLIAWLRNPLSYLPHSAMPRYGWSDEALYEVSQYLINKLADAALLDGVPQLGAPTREEAKTGKRLFREKGCSNCHALTGIGALKDFGPDLTSVGAKNASECEFTNERNEHNLVSCIQGTLQSPVPLNLAARMPLYAWKQSDLDAVTVALLSQTGPAPSALQHLVVPRREESFEAAGAFAGVYERYKCYVCHRFKGHGGTLAPDLSYEGSRAQKKWIADFLRNPQAIRPTLILRMPQFSMPDSDAEIATEFLSMALQKPGVYPESTDSRQFTPAMVSTGKQLYEVKYQCQSCHTIGGPGSYVGPDLSNSGNRLTPAWIETWLRNPQDLQPAAIEPRRNLTDEEIRALTAYLITLRSGNTLQTPGNGASGRVTLQGVGR
jgi:mono/diheme cytochrome c family protein